MITPEEENMSKGNDFGFTFEGETSSVLDNSTKEKLDKIMSLVNNFLDKLASNPESETLKWPDRGPRVRDFKNKINTIYLDNSAR